MPDTSALAAQNAVIAAQSIGRGVTYLGSMRNRAQDVADLVGLPKYSFVLFGMAVGYPDPEGRALLRSGRGPR
jgi:nitroreductase